MTELLAAAPEDGERVRFRAHLFATADSALACEVLAETHPPQPGGATVPLAGVDVRTWPGAERSGDDAWTPTPRAITGTWRDGCVHVDSP